MRRLLALIAVLSLPLLLVAAERAEPNPNTLTAKEAADGWLLLFDGQTTFGWDVDGEAKVEKGELVLGGARATVVTMPLGYAEMHWEYRVDGGASPVWKLEATRNGKSEASEKGAMTRAAKGGQGLPIVQRLRIESAPKTAIATSTDFKGDTSTGMTLVTTTTVRPDCRVSVRIELSAGTRLTIRYCKLKPSGLTALFNGKDLTGWKVYKGDPRREKSKWSVTKEGWLNVKDGAGDLQTEKTFDDFVLQLDCISNGKHLNSGLFFRCLPGEYQQGYEAQIRNQFTDKPTQKYTVEVYDPQTNRLFEKRNVMSTAFDYGTGAIYRRVPARKGVAKDGEWFTLTLVARGRRIATWVNGIQVVDWTDNRPANDNGRNGYREKAGAMSIQGHDPTTDLSFRNIRVAPIPR